jgi:hypothetical protein
MRRHGILAGGMMPPFAPGGGASLPWRCSKSHTIGNPPLAASTGRPPLRPDPMRHPVSESTTARKGGSAAAGIPAPVPAATYRRRMRRR